MNANYIYDIYETTHINGCPDLTIGLAMPKVKSPIPEGMTEAGIRKFISRHAGELVAAFKYRDRAIFTQTVAACEAEDAAKAAAKAEEEAGCADGACDIPGM